MNKTCARIISESSLQNKLRPEDFFRLAFIPLVCVCGMFTNLFNIIVFTNPRMKNSTFRYMLAISLNDFVYLFFCAPLSIDFCLSCHQIKYTQQYAIYLLYLDDYFTSGQAIFCILIEIVLSIERHKIITNKKTLAISYKWIMCFMFIVSALFYFPIIFLKTRYECEPSSVVILEFTDKANEESELYESIYLIPTMLRLLLGVIVLSMINFRNLAQFSKMFLNKKALIKNEPKRPTLYDIKSEKQSQPAQQQLPQQQQQVMSPIDSLKEMKASRNMTLMVVFTCGLNFVGMLPHSLMRVMKLSSDLEQRYWFSDFEMVTTAILLMSHSCTFFVYYCFNSMFYSISKRCFRKVCFIFYRRINVVR